MAGTSQDALQPGPPCLSTALCGTLVTVEVGPERKKYNIHKPILTHYSEYFGNALRGPWKEAKEGVVPLLDIEPRIFDIFADWLYSNTLPKTQTEWLSKIGHPSTDPNLTANMAELTTVLLKAYIFGDRLLAPTLRSAILDCLTAHLILPNDFRSTAEFCNIAKFAYSNIPADRVLLQYLVDMYCKDWSHKKDTANTMLAQKELPMAFLHRAMRRFSEMRFETIEMAEAELKKTLAEDAQRSGSVGWKKLPDEAAKVAMCLRPRCYREHLTTQEKEACAKVRVHMKYDKDADYGYFDRGKWRWHGRERVSFRASL